jgi:hypothetical protein
MGNDTPHKGGFFAEGLNHAAFFGCPRRRAARDLAQDLRAEKLTREWKEVPVRSLPLADTRDSERRTA